MEIYIKNIYSVFLTLSICDGVLVRWLWVGNNYRMFRVFVKASSRNREAPRWQTRWKTESGMIRAGLRRLAMRKFFLHIISFLKLLCRLCVQFPLRIWLHSVCNVRQNYRYNTQLSTRETPLGTDLRRPYALYVSRPVSVKVQCIGFKVDTRQVKIHACALI